MKYFLAGYNLSKNSKFSNFFLSQDTSPLDICHSNISIRSSVRGEIFLLKLCPFLAQEHNMKHFGPFCTSIYITSTVFLRVYKSSKKDKNMMSCTRIYVEPTYSLVRQARKGILLSPLKRI